MATDGKIIKHRRTEWLEYRKSQGLDAFVQMMETTEGMAPADMKDFIYTKEEWDERVRAANEFYANTSPEAIEEWNAALLEGKATGQHSQPPQHHIAPGYVYVIRQGGYYKIGLSRTPKRRIAAISSSNACPIETVCVIKTPDMLNLEQSLHVRFAEKRINGE